MARRIRLEVEGGLYHLITRGVDRQDIFHDEQDFAKFLAIMAKQKLALPFYLYAYCLMTNHLHLLIERRVDDIGRIMQRVLTGYAQYYNRRYGRVGHVFQGRHKAVLCQSDPYLAELVRYIHLNPVRAKMVDLPEQYPYSSHREYMGIRPNGMVDVDPVLRRFGRPRAAARQRFADHVAAGMRLGPQSKFYASESGILGSEEFVDSMIHQIGDHNVHAAARRRREQKAARGCDIRKVLELVEQRTEVPIGEICSGRKDPSLVYAKEVMIISARRMGSSLAEISDALGINPSTVTRRHDAARRRMLSDQGMAAQVDNVIEQYRSRYGTN
jgi:putative transposase